MINFLLVFAAVYGSMQGYLFWQARRAFALGGVPAALLAVFLVSMMAAPFLSRELDRRDVVSVAWPLALAGYVWLAATFWLVLLFAARDLWNLGVAGGGLLFPGAARLSAPLRGSTLLFLGAVLVAGLWGFREAGRIRLVEATVRTAHLPADSKPVRIAFISDVHMDLLVGKERLREIVRVVKEARPDLLISGGDLVDGSATHLDHASRLLAEVRPPLGKFAVTGNHEYYAGIRGSERFAAAAGFRMLHGESVLAGGRLLIAGVDDPAARMAHLSPTPGEDELLPEGENRPPVVLVKHRPAVSPGAVGRFDVQLSGHTHGGQIFPFRYLVNLEYPLPDGLSSLGRGSWLYKGRGTGTWGPPIRFLAPPEVILIVLKPAG